LPKPSTVVRIARLIVRRKSMALQVGDVAPDFSVQGVVGVEKVKVTLSDYRGKKNVVIAFYPLDWTPV
jgi:peroxiredoxin